VSKFIGQGDATAEWTGRILGPAGVGAVAGAQLGKEVNKALGGREEDATDIVAEITVGAIGYAAVSALILVGIGAGMGALVYLFFIPGIGQIGLVIYAVVAAISDASKLAYGQVGADNDYRTEWWKLYHTMVDAFILRGLSESEAARLAYPFCDGYMQKKNELAKLRWMKQPRGLTVSTDLEHERYGADRGYFLVKVPLLSDEADYLQHVPQGEIAYSEVPRIDWYEMPIRNLSRTTTLDPLVAFKRASAPVGVRADKLHFWFNVQDALGERVDPAKALRDGLIGTRWEERQNGTETRYSDPLRFNLMDKGRIAANVFAYVSWMLSSWGAGQSATSHLVYGREQGMFEGSGLEEGKLEYEGQTYDYKAFKK
jgi:hypothetical protein